MILKQVFITKNQNIIYQRIYGKGIGNKAIIELIISIKQDINRNITDNIGSYDFFKNKISYLYNNKFDLFFLFISNLVKFEDLLRTELKKLENHLFMLYKEELENSNVNLINEAIDPFMDSIHRNLKPKISLVGYSGVGKTTITRLIKADEIPMQHIATINGEVSTIRIANLNFLLWDFAGQEQFSLLWNKFIRGSDAILIITNSSIENVDKSKFFLELIKKEAPYAHIAVIANKQDTKNAISTQDIEKIIGLKTYSMIAINPENRMKMMQVIADLLEMNANLSPLLKPLIERDNYILDAEKALMNGNLKDAADLFLKISDLCLHLGDDSISKDFLQKSEKINYYLKNTI